MPTPINFFLNIVMLIRSIFAALLKYCTCPQYHHKNKSLVLLIKAAAKES